MKEQRVILTAAVVCDRCGETIKAGEEAVVTFDEKTGECKFTHAECPNEDEAKVRRPTPPKPRVRGAVRVRTSNRRKGNSNHNNRKVR